jgi:hypothetical protein
MTARQYIIAGQRAFEQNWEVSEDDLSSGIRSLRRAANGGSRRENRAGFKPVDEIPT